VRSIIVDTVIEAPKMNNKSDGTNMNLQELEVPQLVILAREVRQHDDVTITTTTQRSA